MRTQRWEVEHPFGEPGVYVSDQNTALIAKLYGPDAEANAQKVAALPLLLEALEIAIPALLAYSNSGLMRCEFEDEDGYSVPLAVARAAIAKAKGELTP